MNINNARIDLFHTLIIQAQTIHAGQSDIMKEHVSLFQHGNDGGFAIFGLGVQLHGALVAIEAGIDRPQVARRRCTGIAHHVARLAFLAGLDLDDVSTEIAKDQCRKRAKYDR